MAEMSNANMGSMSATSKYSKYSSRVRHSQNKGQFSVFKNKMQRVILSVDRRKKFNNTMAPTALGIQSIIIGSSFKGEEEVKDQFPNSSGVRDYTQEYPVEQDIGQSDYPKSTKLEPLRMSEKSNSKVEDRMKNMIKAQSSFKSGHADPDQLSLKESDVDHIMGLNATQLRKSHPEFEAMNGAAVQSEKNKVVVSITDNEDIQPKYDNKTTQNLCDLMNQANTIIYPVRKVNEDESEYDQKVFKKELNPPMNHEGTTVFSKQGFVMVGKGRHEPSDYVSHDNFILEGMNKQIFSNLPLFQKFPILKVFKQWKYNTKYSRYLRNREILCKHLVPSKPQFAQSFMMVTMAINEIKDLKLIEVKKSYIFARKQQSIVEKTEKVDIIKSQADLSKILHRIKNILQTTRNSIQKDDSRLDDERRKLQELAILKKSKHNEHVMFTQARKRKELEGEKLKVAKARHKMFDSLVAYTNRYVVSNLAKILFENKKDFSEMFLDPAVSPQFELSI